MIRMGLYGFGLFHLIMVMLCYTFVGSWLPGGGFEAMRMSTETQIVLVIVSLVFLSIAVLRFVTWVMFAKLGRFGRWLGQRVILDILKATGTRGRNWERDALVRMIWQDIGGGKIKGMKAIENRIRGVVPVRKKAGPARKRKAANDNYWDYGQRKAA